jgi:hypothetical protein
LVLFVVHDNLASQVAIACGNHKKSCPLCNGEFSHIHRVNATFCVQIQKHISI